MALSSVLNRWLNRLYKCLAVFLVLFAVLISALRLLLPYAHNYRANVEDYINETYESNLSIGFLSTSWHSSGPSLIANDVKVFKNELGEFYVDSIDIRIDFWQSLLSQKVITDNFVLSGARLVLDREIISNSVSGETEVDPDKPSLKRLTHFFYEQIGRFSLLDSQLTIHNGEKTHTFLFSELDWLNIDERRLAKAEVIVDGVTSNNLKLLLDISGQDNSDMNGTLFIDANRLNITPWLGKALAIDNDKTDASISFDAWLSIKQGLPQALQLAFADSEIRWQHNNNQHSFALNEGQLLFSNLAEFDQLTINSNDLLFNTNSDDWSPINLQFKKDNANLFAYVSEVNLSTISTLLPLFNAEPTLINAFDTMALTGSAEQLYFQSSDDKYQFSAEFSTLSNNFYKGLPGLNNAAGDVLFDTSQLQINLTASHGALNFDKHFVLPIPYNELVADVVINFDEQGWQLTSETIEINSDELKLNADVGVLVPKEGKAQMSLLASVTEGHVEFAHHYFPLTSMSDSLVNYLKNGLVAGDIEQALVIYHGAFSDFPFEDHSGIFTVDAEIINSEFNFSEDWANITDFSANLNFTNNSMMITGRAGELSGLDVNGVKVGIAELAGDPILTVDVALDNVEPKHVSDLMLTSSLKNTVGKTLQQLEIAGKINGEFSLRLPLERREEVIAKGIIDFDGNQLNIANPEMVFTDLYGQLSFNNDQVTVNDLALNWKNLPLIVDVNGKDRTSYFSTHIDIAANWENENWEFFVPSPLKNSFESDIHWQGGLTLNSHHDGGFSYKADIESTLFGTELMLPAPYNKNANDRTSLTVKVEGGLKTSTVDLTLGEQLSFYGLLNHNSANDTNTHFSRAHLVLGQEKMLLPMDGFHITSALEYADFFSWQPFVLAILDSIDEYEPSVNGQKSQAHLTPFIAKPNRIRGSIGKLDILSQTLTGVSFNVFDQQHWQLLQLNAKEARAEIKFFPSWLTQGIDVEADFLHLYQSDETEIAAKNRKATPELIEESLSMVEKLAAEENIFSNMPPVTFNCDDCKVANVDFGQLSFDIKRPNDTMITMKNFVASRDKSKLTFEGQWLYKPNELGEVNSATYLVGQLNANDIEFEMEKLGFASSIKDSGAVLDFSLDWQGGPQHFDMKELNGNLSVEFDDGVLADVDDKGVRVASLLSLGSLARKLKLDFRDIFSEGMFYSSITGDLQINQGIMYTENVEMNGAAGDLTVKGNTNLTQGVLDYRMNYKPNLTSSLPTIAWIATLNPVIFITGLAINEIITASVIYEVVFEVTGDVDQPIVREVDRKNQDISVGSSTPPKLIDEPAKPAEKPVSSSGAEFKDIKVNTGHSVVNEEEVVDG